MIVGHKLIGHGPKPVLVLHGWFGDENFLEPMYPGLSTDEFTYCCVAYRGYGASISLSGQFTLDEIAVDARDVADHLGWGKFSVVGHSMGAKAAQKLMLLAPGRVQRLVAITPVPASRVPFDPAGWELFSGAADDQAKRAAIIDFSTGGRLGQTWIERMAARSVGSSQRAAFAAYLEAWAHAEFSAQVNGSKTPLLVLIGEHDPQLNEPAMHATYLAWFSNATLELVGNAGHYPMDEAPVALAARMERFLRSS